VTDRPSILGALGKLLQVSVDEVEAVLRHDERRARETVSRRNFMSAAASIASAPFVPQEWLEMPTTFPTTDLFVLPFDFKLIASAIGPYFVYKYGLGSK
jgi:hypothetical protein